MNKLDSALLICLSLAAAALGIDLLTRTAMAGAALYPAAVLAMALRRPQRDVLIAAGACSLLVAAAFLSGASTGQADNLLGMVLNRFGALAGIWVVAGLGKEFAGLRDRLAVSRNELGLVSDRLARTEAMLADTEMRFENQSAETSATLGQVSESLQTEIAQRERIERALQDARA